MMKLNIGNSLETTFTLITTGNFIILNAVTIYIKTLELNNLKLGLLGESH